MGMNIYRGPEVQRAAFRKGASELVQQLLPLNEYPQMGELQDSSINIENCSEEVLEERRQRKLKGFLTKIRKPTLELFRFIATLHIVSYLKPIKFVFLCRATNLILIVT